MKVSRICLSLLLLPPSIIHGWNFRPHPRQTIGQRLSASTSSSADNDDNRQLRKETYISPIISSQGDNLSLWEQIKLEATATLDPEIEAGPLVYQAILSQPNLVEALVSVIAHEIETELIKATELHNLFLEMLTPQDEIFIHNDVIAAATRSPSINSATTAVLFHTGLHALVCYRVGHRLWKADRKGLAYYLQSTVSRRYSADIHPACQMGGGIYLCSAAGVVIGETAVTGNDVSILHGVTLGGTGKERGNRHPKVGNGVILEDGATVLGNIKVGDGALVTAKSIVTKPVEPLAVVSGVPAKMTRYRSLDIQDLTKCDLEQHLVDKYVKEWQDYLP